MPLGQPAHQRAAASRRPRRSASCRVPERCSSSRSERPCRARPWRDTSSARHTPAAPGRQPARRARPRSVATRDWLVPHGHASSRTARRQGRESAAPGRQPGRRCRCGSAAQAGTGASVAPAPRGASPRNGSADTSEASSGSGDGAVDHRATEANLAFVDHRRLSRRDGPLGLLEFELECRVVGRSRDRLRDGKPRRSAGNGFLPTGRWHPPLAAGADAGHPADIAGAQSRRQQPRMVVALHNDTAGWFAYPCAPRTRARARCRRVGCRPRASRRCRCPCAGPAYRSSSRHVRRSAGRGRRGSGRAGWPDSDSEIRGTAARR